ncbi:hypothetical protein JTE90_029500 [Oedothorax gibbosus]|uniref:poly(A)-specific ribonuclease n=1 Tax=Oedothorax gibbosus TaxID=931172 RepID=A0AAV6UFF2_9ARAC|nr:hypothetical protein JTE90_029500 [Oedothorax gibbosus]
MPAAFQPTVESADCFQDECGIRDVWAHNLEDEFKIIRHIVQRYKFIVMDTKFPSIFNQPNETLSNKAEYHYRLFKYNINYLKIIRLDLTILDANGNHPPGFTKWQFNFKLKFIDDLYDQDCVDLLTSSGIQYLKHEEDGIDSNEFAELLMTSGVVLCDSVNWISFHCGYDFAYLLKLLTDKDLPEEESEFLDLLEVYFPTIIKNCKNLKSGMQEVLKQLFFNWIGASTDDSLFKISEIFRE